MMRVSIVFTLGLFASLAQAENADSPPDLAAGLPPVVRRAELNPDLPVFVPVNPRIATTISFPKPIGEPVGTGFIDAEALQKNSLEGKPIRAQGEYVIDYAQGETFFTIQPTAKGELLNLNVPYEGTTIVLYFYLVDKPLSALASLIFQEKPVAERANLPHRAVSPPSNATQKENPATAAVASIRKADATATSPFAVPSPARLDGFLRKLRLVHAAQAGSELDDLSAAMHLQIAISAAENPGSTDIAHPVSDAGLYQLILLRAVRDPNLDAVGFVLLIKNNSNRELIFDPRTFSARCGIALYTARAIEAPARLRPRETAAGYFVVVGSGDDRPGYLLAANDWRLSVNLLSPQVTPGESLVAVKPACP